MSEINQDDIWRSLTDEERINIKKQIVRYIHKKSNPEDSAFLEWEIKNNGYIKSLIDDELKRVKEDSMLESFNRHLDVAVVRQKIANDIYEQFSHRLKKKDNGEYEPIEQKSATYEEMFPEWGYWRL